MTANLNTNQSKWESQLHRQLPLYGHRNWIVVADSAYPAQSRPGIETIRPHSSQKAQTPDQAYFNRQPVPLAA